MLRILCLLVSVFYISTSYAQDDCIKEIKDFIKDKRATVGVAYMVDGKIFTVNNDHQYPLMSVFKFHVAFTVLKKMESERTSLSEKLLITTSQMKKNTYSPLRKIYPDQDFQISLSEMIRYCVSESDNNACDILIEYVGGIENVDRQIRELGMSDFHLTETEHTMHVDLMNCYKNWSTPVSALKLLEKVYSEKLLKRRYNNFLKRVMIETSTGINKIRSGLPSDIVLGHKTGSSDRLSDGVKIADNDIGVIYLPRGKKCYLAVLIKDSMESDSENGNIIATITKIIYSNIKKADSQIIGN